MKVDLEAIEKRGAALARGEWRRARVGDAEAFVLRDAGGHDAAHLYAAKALGEAVMSAGSDLAALAAEVRRLRAELEEAQARTARAETSASATKAPSRPPAELDEEASVLLAAPFRVSANAAKAAQTDAFVALAVQAAKALQPDAREVERARLIAMALAATTGDMDAFWAARRQRATKTKKK